MLFMVDGKLFLFLYWAITELYNLLEVKKFSVYMLY
jgi:hypothetical protein